MRTDRESTGNTTWISPTIGMLCWEKGKVPRGLEQLAELPGNVTNPSTFAFPIRYERIPGANIDTIIKWPNMAILNSMIEAAQRMEQDGVKAITTSCGFNALFQEELADSVSIPVFTSSLLLVPFVHRMLRKDQAIGVITADKGSLKEAHLRSVGIDTSIPVCIAGLEETTAFSQILTNPYASFDVQEFKGQLIRIVNDLLSEASNVGAIVLECTDLPPFSAAIREETGLPVFDIVTLINIIYDAIVYTF